MYNSTIVDKGIGRGSTTVDKSLRKLSALVCLVCLDVLFFEWGAARELLDEPADGWCNMARVLGSTIVLVHYFAVRSARIRLILSMITEWVVKENKKVVIFAMNPTDIHDIHPYLREEVRDLKYLQGEHIFCW